MSFYVKRERTNPDTGSWQSSWTGPIPSFRQVEREAECWRDAGWQATVVPSSPEVRAQVRAWDKAKKVAR